MKAIRFTEIMRQTQAVLHARLNLKAHEHRELEKKTEHSKSESWTANRSVGCKPEQPELPRTSLT